MMTFPSGKGSTWLPGKGESQAVSFTDCRESGKGSLEPQ